MPLISNLVILIFSTRVQLLLTFREHSLIWINSSNSGSSDLTTSLSRLFNKLWSIISGQSTC